MEKDDLREKLRQDILNVLLKLRMEDLELLRDQKRFQPTEVINEAIRLKKEVFHTK